MLFIFLISASYAIYSGGDILAITSSNEVQNNDQNPPTDVSNDNNSIAVNAPNNQKGEDVVVSPTKSADLLTQKYAIKYGAGEKLSFNESTIDMFVQCACGRFAPYGEVSKQLPEEALCSYIQSRYVGTGDCNADHAYTYDEAMAIWEHDGPSSLAIIKQYTDAGLDIHTDDLPEDDVQVPSQPQNNEVQNMEEIHYEVSPYNVA